MHRLYDGGRSTQPTTGPRVHRAKWIVVTPETVLENGYLLVANGRIVEAGNGRRPTDAPVTDHGPGVILPALVNAHTHLELSALKGNISAADGFEPWVRELLKARETAGPKVLLEGAKAGIAELRASGCGVVADISTLGLTRDILLASGLGGVWFREYLGGPDRDISPEDLKHRGESGVPDLALSLAGHAPHTTSPEMLVRLSRATRKMRLPFAIHLDESDAEREFLSTAGGAWADFLETRGIDFKGWPLPAPNPVRYAESLRILGNHTLAVHLIGAGPDDFAVLRKHHVNLCLCPRSNERLHGRLPDIEGMLRAGLKPCLGTDSLAGTDSLSIFDEMAFTARRFPKIPPERIFEMATANGAFALGLADCFGDLRPGKRFRAVHLRTDPPKQIMERIVHANI